MEPIGIEQLTPAEEKEALEVLAQAFNVPVAGPTAQGGSFGQRAMCKLLHTVARAAELGVGGPRVKLGLGSDRANQTLYGIRDGEKLVCVAVLYEGEAKPTRAPLLLSALTFFLNAIFWLGRLVGWRVAIEIDRFHREAVTQSKNPWCSSYLKLISLGTLPAYQGRGLGRRMLRYVRGVAASKGYVGVQLVTASQNESAVRLYREEGFVVVHESKLGSDNLLFMALTLTTNQT